MAEEFSIYAVLEDWTRSIIEVFDAAHLFDLPSGASIYRCRGLPTYHGRGYDDLPQEVLAVFGDTFVTELTRDELMRALGRVIYCMLLDTDGVHDLAAKVKPQLQELTAAWDA